MANNDEGSIVSLEKIVEELETQIEKQFTAQFKKINEEFGKYFKILFDLYEILQFLLLTCQLRNWMY